MQSQVGPDSVVAGRYTLERCINSGGIGSLWRARDEQTGRPCAMRLADGTGHNIFELAARYRAEVDIIERIRCENVLDIFDYGDWNDMPYLVVEHVEGEDLATRLRREGHLPPELAYRLLAQTARALARAHAVGIVHGDVTPENIVIAAEGMQSVAKIYNFSLTQRTAEISVGTVTKIGSYLRLPYYASPEQAAGKLLDWRSDLWSLGVLGYECLSGKKPFEGNVFGDLVAQILCEPIAPLVLPGTNTPPKLADWWQKACARDLSKRFQSAKEMSDALGQTFNFPIVFVPDGVTSGMGGTTSSTPAPVVLPGASEEPRVGLRRKSVPKMVRQNTQIGLGAVKSRIPTPTPFPVPTIESASIKESGPVKQGTPVTGSALVTGSAPAIENLPVEVAASVIESANLDEDLFEGFQTSEAPTLAFRQSAAVPAVEEEIPIDIVDSQRHRTKASRRTVTWVVALAVAFVSVPLVWKFVIAKQRRPMARSSVFVASSSLAKAQFVTDLSRAPAATTAGLAESSVKSPTELAGESNIKPASSLADASVESPVSLGPDDPSVAATALNKVSTTTPHNEKESSPEKSPASGKFHSVPPAAKAKPMPPTDKAKPMPPAAPPKPVKSTAGRDYGI